VNVFIIIIGILGTVGTCLGVTLSVINSPPPKSLIRKWRRGTTSRR
jgi:hypothetical protein